MLNLHCFKARADEIQTGDLLLGAKPGMLLSVTKRIGAFLDLNVVPIDNRPTVQSPFHVHLSIRWQLFKTLADTADNGEAVWRVQRIETTK